MSNGIQNHLNNFYDGMDEFYNILSSIGTYGNAMGTDNKLPTGAGEGAYWERQKDIEHAAATASTTNTGAEKVMTSSGTFAREQAKEGQILGVQTATGDPDLVDIVEPVDPTETSEDVTVDLGFGTSVASTPETSAADASGQVSTAELEAIRSALSTAKKVCEETVTNAINECKGIFDGLNTHTKERLGLITADSLLADLNKFASNWMDELDGMIAWDDASYTKAQEANEGTGGTGDTPASITPDGGSGYGGGNKGGKSGSSGGGTDPKPVTPDPVKPDVFIQSAVVGTLLFTVITPLYETIGGPSTIQSSLTSTYDVVGIIYQNGKYYYRIYDASLKKFYYAEVNENSKLTTEYKELLKSKEGESTMMLTSPKIGEDVFSKMTDANTAYFIKDTVEQDGIPYGLVVDGTDGNSYYVPMDSTTEVVTIDSLLSGTTSSTESAS